MKYLTIILVIVSAILTSCGGNSKNDDSNVTENLSYARDDGFSKGWGDGFEAGKQSHNYNKFYYYDDKTTSYKSEDGIKLYKDGYSYGYKKGYDAGVESVKEQIEREKKKKQLEYEKLHNMNYWDKAEVHRLYVYLEGVDDDDVADYVARERYDGDYIREGFKYFAEISPKWSKYNVTIGEIINSKLYEIGDTDIYIEFTWWNPDIHTGDKGVLDWRGVLSYFYKEPKELN
jgi:hypothetical protein